MKYREHEIDFQGIDSTRFEEICYDLMLRAGFFDLVWRKGGADSGRDIEGRLTRNNELVGRYEERWFIECKRYESGVPAGAFKRKIEWAEAEGVDHLLLIVSTYLSDSGRRWFEKVRANSRVRLHLVEGKQLKQYLLKHQDLLGDYFGSEHSRRLEYAVQAWLLHGVLPSADEIILLLRNISIDNLPPEELALLWWAVARRLVMDLTEDLPDLINDLLDRTISEAPQGEPLLKPEEFLTKPTMGWSTPTWAEGELEIQNLSGSATINGVDYDTRYAHIRFGERIVEFMLGRREGEVIGAFARPNDSKAWTSLAERLTPPPASWAE